MVSCWRYPVLSIPEDEWQQRNRYKFLRQNEHCINSVFAGGQDDLYLHISYAHIPMEATNWDESCECRKIGCLPYAAGKQRPNLWLIVGERHGDDDDYNKISPTI